MFCSIANILSKLWQHDPHVALKTLKKYYEVVRTQSKRLAGYEMPTDGNTMIFVFHEAVAAVNFCMRVQNGNYYYLFFISGKFHSINLAI